MVGHHFDALITIDKNLSQQQAVKKIPLIIIVSRIRKSKIEFMKELLPELKRTIRTMKKNHSYQIR